MAGISIKRRIKTKHVTSVSDDETHALIDQELHRLCKSSKSKSKKDKKKSDKLSLPTQSLNPDSDVGRSTRESSVERTIIYRTECPCSTHYDKQLIVRSYDITVNELFDLLFGNNEFVQAHRKAQNIFDDTATDWIMNEETKCRERTLNYKIPYDAAFVGKATISTTEKQTLTHDVAGSHYVVDAEVFNDGVKYSDTFSLCMRYCLLQTSTKTTSLRVTALVRFNKSATSLFKPIIERNAYSSSLEGLKSLNHRLNLHTNFSMNKRNSDQGEVSVNVPVAMNSHDTLANGPLQQKLSDESKKTELHKTSTSLYHSNALIYLFIIIIAFILCINLYLYIKLKQMDKIVDKLARSIKHIMFASSQIVTTKLVHHGKRNEILDAQVDDKTAKDLLNTTVIIPRSKLAVVGESQSEKLERKVHAQERKQERLVEQQKLAQHMENLMEKVIHETPLSRKDEDKLRNKLAIITNKVNKQIHKTDQNSVGQSSQLNLRSKSEHQGAFLLWSDKNIR
ncbi:unnamed protein product [Adineta steineri]|uniref:VASt domain-containing protein n=2 Tax=Adineta steineri TaxID=433720 RepID=A0A813RU79_9BILA|nr:unnamed protein product [Adineta steineri]CAF0940843.1 unnamed protein product [Adineta steineri]